MSSKRIAPRKLSMPGLESMPNQSEGEDEIYFTPPVSPSVSMALLAIGDGVQRCKQCGCWEESNTATYADRSSQTLTLEELKAEQDKKDEKDEPPAPPLPAEMNQKPTAEVSRGRSQALRSSSCEPHKRSEQETGDEQGAIATKSQGELSDGKEPASTSKRRAISVKPTTRQTPKQFVAPPMPVPLTESDCLTPYEEPFKVASEILAELGSTDWTVNATALNNFVRLARFHLPFIELDVQRLALQFVPFIRNLRSQVSRAACLAAAELFRLPKFEVTCDEVVAALLQRSSDMNRFLRADAMTALDSMVMHMQPTKVLGLLATKGVCHQNAVVKTTTSNLLLKLIERLGCDRVYNGLTRENRDKIFNIGAKLLQEGSLETRNNAKLLFKELMLHRTFNKVVLDALSSRTYANVEKMLRSIRREFYE